MAKLQTVSIKKPRHSNFNLSRKVRFSAAPGYLYPILTEELLPGDRVSLNLKSLIKTFPLLAPLMGTFKVQFDTFFCPTRLYVRGLHFNYRNTQGINPPFPTYAFNGTIDGATSTTKVHESSILNFLGIPAGFDNYREESAKPSDLITFNGIPLLAYYDIYRNWYINPQEDRVRGNCGFDSGESKFSARITDLIERFATADPAKDNLWVNAPGGGGVTHANDPYCSFSPNKPFSGLMQRTYNPDLCSAWLNYDTYTAITQASGTVVTSDSRFTVNQIRTANKLLKFAERAFVSGGRYPDWVKAQFGVQTDHKYEVPEFLGSCSTNLQFEDVVQTAPGTGEDPLGSLGGRGLGLLSGAGQHFTATENGYLMVIASIIPVVDYFQGVAPLLLKKELAHTFAPAKDCIGFQPLLEAYLYGTPNLDGNGKSTPIIGNPQAYAVGYQPAWTEYTTAVNRLHGSFCSSLKYWALARHFEYGSLTSDKPVLDYSSYVNPDMYNFAFANTSPTAENFLIQVAADFFAKRPISKQSMPSL